jgi:hypothetical protein
MYKMKSKKQGAHEAFGWSFFIRNIDEQVATTIFVIVTVYDRRSIPFTHTFCFFSLIGGKKKEGMVQSLRIRRAVD